MPCVFSVNFWVFCAFFTVFLQFCTCCEPQVLAPRSLTWALLPWSEKGPAMLATYSARPGKQSGKIYSLSELSLSHPWCPLSFHAQKPCCPPPVTNHPPNHHYSHNQTVLLPNCQYRLKISLISTSVSATAQFVLLQHVSILCPPKSPMLWEGTQYTMHTNGKRRTRSTQWDYRKRNWGYGVSLAQQNVTLYLRSPFVEFRKKLW
jgi:hypothetical protein